MNIIDNFYELLFFKLIANIHSCKNASNDFFNNKPSVWFNNFNIKSQVLKSHYFKILSYQTIWGTELTFHNTCFLPNWDCKKLLHLISELYLHLSLLNMLHFVNDLPANFRHKLMLQPQSVTIFEHKAMQATVKRPTL